MSQSNEWQRVGRGVVLLISLHVGALFFAYAIAMIASALIVSGLVRILPNDLALFVDSLVGILIYGFLFIGITQLIYVIPAIIILNRERQYSLMKGVIIGAVLTALLNAGCHLWVIQAFKAM